MSNLNEDLLRKVCKVELIKPLKISYRDQVLLVRSLTTGRELVIKNLGYTGQGLYNPTELSIPSTIQSPYILSIHKIIDGTKCGIAEGVSYFMDKADYTMNEYVTKRLTLSDKLTLIYQVMTGLSALHEAQRLHLDLKIDNIMVTDGRAQLMDFGYSLKVDQAESGVLMKHRFGTNCYMPPEILNATNECWYSDATDIWYLGHVIVAILTGKVVIPRNVCKSGDEVAIAIWLESSLAKVSDRLRTYRKVTSGLGYSKRTLDRIYQLLEGCFQPDPSQRSRIDDLRSLPLFDPIRDQVEDKYLVLAATRPQPLCDYTETLIWISDFTNTHLGDQNAKLLFLTFDLFYRAIGLLEKTRTMDDHVKQIFMNRMAGTCIWIAYKSIHFQDTWSLRIFDQIMGAAGGDPRYYSMTETRIIAYLQGLLFPDYLYEACLGANHLVKTYQELLFDSVNYVKVDVNAWVRSLGPPEGDKQVTISWLVSQ